MASLCNALEGSLLREIHQNDKNDEYAYDGAEDHAVEDQERFRYARGRPRGDLGLIIVRVHGKVALIALGLADGVVELAIHPFLPEEIAVQHPKRNGRQEGHADEVHLDVGRG